MTLLFMTGDERIDQMLIGLIGIYEIAFPDRVLAYYLTGSYVDGSATSDSDIDFVPIFAQTANEIELRKARLLGDHCTRLTGIQVECSPTDETTLKAKGVKSSIKIGRLLHGSPVLEQYPLEPLAEHTARCIFLAFRSLHVLRGQTAPLHYPLAYPDAAGEFFGYERYGSYLGDNRFGPGLRILVSGAVMMATVLIALKTGIQAGSKQQSIDLYRQQIGDVWSDYVAELYTTCKIKWQYALPELMQEREKLRQITERFLLFENFFLETCLPALKTYQAHESQDVRHFISEALKRISYPEQAS